MWWLPRTRESTKPCLSRARAISRPLTRGSGGTRLDRDLHLFEALFGDRLTASLQIFDVQSDRLLDVPQCLPLSAP